MSMNRRRYLGATAGLLISLSGCLAGRSGPPSTNETTAVRTNEDGPRTTDSKLAAAIADHQFRALEYDHEYSGPTFSSVDAANHAAEVRFQAASNRIVVEGWMHSGSRSCRTTRLDTVEYTTETQSLHLTILDTFEEGASGCTTEIDPVTYEAIISFESNYPETVHITHRDEVQDDDTYNETFHREAIAVTTSTN